MDRLIAMGAFVAVAELRGFAPAARRLGASPSSVTRLVAALEEHLGTRLLQRTTRSVTLTDAGARYLERARRILGEVEDAERTARAERTKPSGRLVVAAPSVFGRRKVAPLVSAFLRKYPAVSGELRLADRLENLVEEGIDVAVRIGALEDSSLVAIRAGETRRVVVGSPSYLGKRRALRSPADLAAHTIVQFTGATPGREWRFFRDGKEERVAIAPSFATNSADAAIGHAEGGGGLTMVLSYQVMEAIEAGRLVRVLEGFEAPPLPIQLVYPSARLLSASVRELITMTKATCVWRFV